MKDFEAQYFDRVDGNLVTYKRTVTTVSKAKAHAFFKEIATEFGWRLVQFYQV